MPRRGGEESTRILVKQGDGKEEDDQHAHVQQRGLHPCRLCEALNALEEKDTGGGEYHCRQGVGYVEYRGTW